MIGQKAREIGEKADMETDLGPFHNKRLREKAARLGIIEGLEMAAKVADGQAINRQRAIDHLPDGHSNSYSRGGKITAESIAANIRALIGETK